MRHDRKKEALQKIRGHCHDHMMTESNLKMTDSDSPEKASFKREEDVHYANEDLVVVSLKDCPEWPARVQKAEDFGLYTIPEMIFVTCFGTNEVRFCRDYEVCPLTPNKRKTLECKLHLQSTESTYKLAIQEVINLDKQKTAVPDFCEKTVKVEKQNGVSYPRKRLRKMQQLSHIRDEEAAQKSAEYERGVEELWEEMSENCEVFKLEAAFFKGKMRKTFGGVLIPADHKYREQDSEPETGFKLPELDGKNYD